MLIVAGKVGAGPVVPSAADEVDLDADLTACLECRQRVGVVDTLDIDILMRLDGSEGPNPVAISGCGLEIQRFGGLQHGVAEQRLDLPALAGQEGESLRNLLGIVLLRNKTDARRRAALDLILKAGARANRENGIGAVAEQESPL